MLPLFTYYRPLPRPGGGAFSNTCQRTHLHTHREIFFDGHFGNAASPLSTFTLQSSKVSVISPEATRRKKRWGESSAALLEITFPPAVSTCVDPVSTPSPLARARPQGPLLLPRRVCAAHGPVWLVARYGSVLDHGFPAATSSLLQQRRNFIFAQCCVPGFGADT